MAGILEARPNSVPVNTLNLDKVGPYIDVPSFAPGPVTMRVHDSVTGAFSVANRLASGRASSNLQLLGTTETSLAPASRFIEKTPVAPKVESHIVYTVDGSSISSNSDILDAGEDKIRHVHQLRIVSQGSNDGHLVLDYGRQLL